MFRVEGLGFTVEGVGFRGGFATLDRETLIMP